jgi:signal transduction histidine kinase
MRICVQDDGCGFDSQSLPIQEGLGLANVRERLNLAFKEATFSITSQVGAGTQTIIEIPVA